MVTHEREVSFSLPVALIRQYEEAGERLDLSRSLVMRRAVELGLDGAVASLQRDLEAKVGERRQGPGTLAQLAKEAESRATEIVRGIRTGPRGRGYPSGGPAPSPARNADTEVERCLVLTQAPESSYRDELGARYHFPDRYRSQISSGDLFIYYEPRRGYIGGGRIGPITRDPERSGHWYAGIVNYKRFARGVGLKDEQGSYWEKRPDIKKPAFQKAVRRITRETYGRVLAAGEERRRSRCGR